MFRAPTQAGLPPLSRMLDDMPARPARIARHLGLSARTLQRYRQAEQAPRAVMLALFWETQWGRGLADAQDAYEATLARGMADALGRENAALRRRIEILMEERTALAPLAANLPVFHLG